MTTMNAQDIKGFVKEMAPSVDLDDNADHYNRPPEMTGDPRDRKSTYDLYKVDYKWVTNQTDRKELRLAYFALREDGGFQHLMKHTLDRLKVIDPKFMTTEDFNKYTPADEAIANDDVLAFLDEMHETDKVIRGDNVPAKSARSKEIFAEETTEVPREQTEEQLDFITKLENKRRAEDARYVGNEHMRVKDYGAAIEAYSRSIVLNSGEAATYCNRAMAYLR